MKFFTLLTTSTLTLMLIGGCAKQDASKHDEMTQPSGMMMKELGQKDANYEDRFIDLMIPHHEAAVMMANDAIEKANRPELKQMAQEIITAQEKEIVQMREWRKQWYGH